MKIWEMFFKWSSKTNRDGIAAVEAVVSMGFYPKLGNPALARVTTMAALEMQRMGLPRPLIVVPYDVKEHMPDTSCESFDGAGGTLQYLLYVAELCCARGITDIVIIANQDHYWRSVWVAQHLGLRVVEVNMSDMIPYDPGISRSWFLVKEVLKRILYRITGKIGSSST